MKIGWEYKKVVGKCFRDASKYFLAKKKKKNWHPNKLLVSTPKVTPRNCFNDARLVEHVDHNIYRDVPELKHGTIQGLPCNIPKFCSTSDIYYSRNSIVKWIEATS